MSDLMDFLETIDQLDEEEKRIFYESFVRGFNKGRVDLKKIFCDEDFEGEDEVSYTLEELINKFKEHSEEFEAERKIRSEEYPMINNNDFNLPEAFLTILSEIKELKERIK